MGKYSKPTKKKQGATVFVKSMNEALKDGLKKGVKVKNKAKSSPESVYTLLQLLDSLKLYIRDSIAIDEIRADLLGDQYNCNKEWLDRILTELFKLYSYSVSQPMCNNDGDVYVESENHYFRL